MIFYVNVAFFYVKVTFFMQPGIPFGLKNANDRGRSFCSVWPWSWSSISQEPGLSSALSSAYPDGISISRNFWIYLRRLDLQLDALRSVETLSLQDVVGISGVDSIFRRPCNLRILHVSYSTQRTEDAAYQTSTVGPDRCNYDKNISQCLV